MTDLPDLPDLPEPPPPPPDALPVAYPGLQGLSWVTPNELRLLTQSVVAGDRVLEVGTAAGVTAARLADEAAPGLLVCVDTFVYRADPHRADSDAERWAKWRANARPCMRLWYGDLGSFAAVAAPAAFDVALVDADHTLPGVLSDLVLAARLVRPGGLLLAHDYGDPNWPDVTAAVDHFARTFGHALVERVGSLVVLRAREERPWPYR